MVVGNSGCALTFRGGESREAIPQIHRHFLPEVIGHVMSESVVLAHDRRWGTGSRQQAGPGKPVQTTVLADNPTHFWELNETSGAPR